MVFDGLVRRGDLGISFTFTFVLVVLVLVFKETFVILFVVFFIIGLLFINVDVAKKTAKFIFGILDEHFKKMNMYFEDVCFMLTVEGDVMYGEVSQDCGRYKYIEEDKLTDLDKDVWRKWGSFEMVLTKYQMMGNIVEKYIKKVFYNEE